MANGLLWLHSEAGYDLVSARDQSAMLKEDLQCVLISFLCCQLKWRTPRLPIVCVRIRLRIKNATVAFISRIDPILRVLRTIFAPLKILCQLVLPQIILSYIKIFLRNLVGCIIATSRCIF